jgi:HlyD family secretion protein
MHGVDTPATSRLLTKFAMTLVCTAVVLGCSSNEPVVKKAETSSAVPVRTVAVVTSQVQRATTQPATVHAYIQADIRSLATGYVSEVKVDIGDVVEAGAILAVIDVPELKQQRRVIEARIKRLQAEEQRFVAGIQLAQANVASFEAKQSQRKSELEQADASVAASEATLNRTSDLVQRQSLQDRMLDEARMQRDAELASKAAMASAVDSATAEVSVAKAQLAAAETELVAAQAETEISRRQLEELDVLLGYALLKAPFSGVVTQRNLDPGDLVREANEVGVGRPLFVISQMDKVRVSIPVPESDAPRVNRGDEVTLTFPSFASEKPIVGVVSRFSSSLDPSTRTMTVEADLPNPDGKLIPGMFGQASIKIASQVAANMLPSRAVRFSETGQAFVYVVSPDETISIANVTMGSDNGNSIEILAGVQPGERVVDAHLKRFTAGQKVTVLTN